MSTRAFFILFFIVLTVTSIAIFGAVYSYYDSTKEVTRVSEIIDKHEESYTTYIKSGDVLLPIINTRYYFTLDNRDVIQVSKSVYYSHIVGDNYSYAVRVPK